MNEELGKKETVPTLTTRKLKIPSFTSTTIK